MSDFGDVLKLFGVMVAVMIPVAIGAAVFIQIMRYGKRARQAPASYSTEELHELRAQMLDREDRVQELEERVDFVERMLTALREGKAPEGLPAPRKETTPV